MAESKSNLIIYQTDDNSIQLEVRVQEDTIWLSQKQMAALFGCSIDNIGLHLKNIYREEELLFSATTEESSVVNQEGNRHVRRAVIFYNLDAVISVGYRINSKRGTQFRIWANQILKDYLLKGYVLDARIDKMEDKLNEHDQKLNILLESDHTKREGIFFDGQIFDAFIFASDLIKSANQSIILIDNYIDESVLFILAKRKENVKAKIFTSKLSKQFQLDVVQYNKQYPQIELEIFNKSHDRFLIIDENIVYHIGASLKDLGKKWFAFSKMGFDADDLIKRLM